MTTLGERIKLVRRDVSRDRFAPMTGISKTALVNYENNERDPGSEYLNKILSLFPDINPAWLLTGEGEMRRSGNSAVSGAVPGWEPTNGHHASKSERARIAEIGGEQVPLPEHERLDRKLLFMTITGLQQVFKDFDIDDPQDQAGVITDVYSHIIEKHLDRTDNTVEGLAKTMNRLFADVELLKSLPSLGLGFLSKIPGQLWERLKLQ